MKKWFKMVKNQLERRLEDYEETISKTYLYIILTLAPLAIVLNIVGLLSIRFYKRKVNQNIIFFSMGLSEILSSMYR